MNNLEVWFQICHEYTFFVLFYSFSGAQLTVNHWFIYLVYCIPELPKLLINLLFQIVEFNLLQF